MLDVRDLSVSYGKHRALDRASVTVQPREIVVILGANGAGKSTLLKAISGICEGQVSGDVVMDGTSISGWPANRIVEQGIALVPEGRGIFADLTVQENLTLGAYSERARDEEAGNLARVYELFPKLRERRRQVVRTMSGGEQQMVAIGRAMMSNPQILTLDEPSLGLSPLLCKDLFRSLERVRDSGIGILLVEQNAKQSLAIADRGYLLENAMITREDAAGVLVNDPEVQKAYLGAAGSAASSQRRAAGPPGKDARPQPQAAQSAPRRSVNPSDIASAAMQSLERKTSRAAPSPKPAPAPSPRQEATQPASKAGSSAHGIGIDDLVARARAKSSETVSRRGNGHATAKRETEGLSGAHAKPPAPEMPQLGDSSDRLRAVLQEIEEAAARARNYRPRGR